MEMLNDVKALLHRNLVVPVALSLSGCTVYVHGHASTSAHAEARAASSSSCGRCFSAGQTRARGISCAANPPRFSSRVRAEKSARGSSKAKAEVRVTTKRKKRERDAGRRGISISTSKKEERRARRNPPRESRRPPVVTREDKPRSARGSVEEPPREARGTAETKGRTPKPIKPPSEPPDNVFGYDRPVYGCFEGHVYFLPEDTSTLPRDYSGLEPRSVLYACEWDIPTRAWEQGFPGVSDRIEWFAIRYTGAFRVAKAGSYEFRISSDDGAKLLIDGKLVVDNDGVHPPREASGEIHLTAGDHDMVLEYFQGPRYHINLQLFATPPGGEEGIFSVRP